MKLGAALSLAIVAGCAHAPPPAAAAGIDRWADSHPQASQELGEWVRNHPDAAARFFEWDAQHPDGSKEFVTWTLVHPRQNIDRFVVTHRGWPVFDQIMEHHRPAAESFMAWARRHPQAAESLMNHPSGLAWAGHHVYASYWHMEDPR